MTTQATRADVVQQMVADEVRSEMARQRKTAGDLAFALGLGQHATGRRLNGLTPFNVWEVARVAEYLGTTFEELISRALSRQSEKELAS